MGNEGKTISRGTIIGLGFIILGVLNLFATMRYKNGALISSTKLPGILFLITGAIIILVNAIKKRTD